MLLFLALFCTCFLFSIYGLATKYYLISIISLIFSFIGINFELINLGFYKIIFSNKIKERGSGKWMMKRK